MTLNLMQANERRGDLMELRTRINWKRIFAGICLIMLVATGFVTVIAVLPTAAAASTS